MSERSRDQAAEMDERETYVMCKRKRKLKSSKAGKLAGRMRQRKYKCPHCGGWHLTSKGVR